MLATKQFMTKGEVINFMLDWTGLMSTEYEVHTTEDMYVTLKDPHNPWCSIHTVLKTMQDHGYAVEYGYHSQMAGPTAIILN